jgi:hypothetical protein
MARRKDRVPEKVNGLFIAFPHAVFDSESFIGASDKSKALLLALARQLNGRNNGHLQLTTKWLRDKGFKCQSSNIKARKELIERGLIVHTKQGGLNMGADLFAVTWVDITNWIGLEIPKASFSRGAYLLCSVPPTRKRKQPIKKISHFDD